MDKINTDKNLGYSFSKNRISGFSLMIVAMVVAVIVSGCQGATSTQNGSGSKDSDKGLSAELFPATEVGMIGTPGAQLSCFWGEDCLGCDGKVARSIGRLSSYCN